MKFSKLFKKICLCGGACILFFSACKKSNDDDTQPPVVVTEQEVLNDFATVLANPNYQDIQSKAVELNNAIQTLFNSLTDANLITAQNAWRAIRVPWEQAEGYLFGPAEDFNYDPATDTWPVNTTEIDSLLAGNNPLLLENIDSLQYSLKGYHPIEYLLFGVGSTKTASQFTPRQLQYLTSLSLSLSNITSQLRNSWDPNLAGNFSNELITANHGSTRYATRKDAFLAITNAMGNICNEVANNKMNNPLVSHDSELVESQYAHNATLDFKNNIIGVQNVYLCRYHSTGKSLRDLVAAKDASLDNSIQLQLTTAIHSLSLIDPNYGIAIFTQQGEIQTAQNAINNLEGSMIQLTNFIQTNITD